MDHCSALVDLQQSSDVDPERPLVRNVRIWIEVRNPLVWIVMLVVKAHIPCIRPHNKRFGRDCIAQTCVVLHGLYHACVLRYMILLHKPETPKLNLEIWYENSLYDPHMEVSSCTACSRSFYTRNRLHGTSVEPKKQRLQTVLQS